MQSTHHQTREKESTYGSNTASSPRGYDISPLEWLSSQGAKFTKVWRRRKKPIGRNWQNTPMELRRVLPHVQARGNVGVLTGKVSNNICLFDADQNFAQFARQFNLDKAPAVRRGTADKGKIFVKVLGDPPASRQFIRKGEADPFLEWLSDGRQGVVVGAPEDGIPYELVNQDSPIPELTKEQLDEIAQAWTGEPITRSPNSNGHHTNDHDSDSEFEADWETAQHWLDKALKRAENNPRNNTGYWLRTQLRDARVPDEIATVIMDEYQQQVPNEGRDHDYTQEEARATDQGVRGSVPRDPPMNVDFHLTDQGNAELFADLHGDSVRYCHGWNKWLIWDGMRWKMDADGWVHRKAAETVREMYRRAAYIGDSDKREKAAKHAISSESAKRQDAMLYLAKNTGRIPVTPGMLDTDPYLFNVLNGTIDLRNGNLLKHDPSNLITKLSPVFYAPEEVSALWERVIAHALQNDEEMINYFNRASGYTLTGDCREEVLHLVYGEKNTSKTTILEALLAVMGEYGKTARFETFASTKYASGSGHSEDVARLAGSRMVVAEEENRGRELNAGLVKRLTGRNRIVARDMHKSSFEFDPQFKLWWASNFPPKMDASDDALWRRIRIIPFEVQLDEDEIDDSIKTRLTTEVECQSAILAWMVRGCLEWQRVGLKRPPEKVKQATQKTRWDLDILMLFIRSQAVVEPGAMCPTSEFHTALKEWAMIRNISLEQMSKQSIGKSMEEMGFAKKKANHEMQYVGIRLVAAEGEE